MNIIVAILPEDCRSGSCDCASASQCKFKRCSNCDDLIDENGKWVDDNQYHGDPDSLDHCPDCGAPMPRR